MAEICQNQFSTIKPPPLSGGTLSHPSVTISDPLKTPEIYGDDTYFAPLTGSYAQRLLQYGRGLHSRARRRRRRSKRCSASSRSSPLRAPCPSPSASALWRGARGPVVWWGGSPGLRGGTPPPRATRFWCAAHITAPRISVPTPSTVFAALSWCGRFS